MIKYLSNCWDTLKTIKLQRKDEICLSVNVMKIEKINCMRARLNPLLFFNGQSAAKSRIEKRSTTIPIWKYTASDWLWKWQGPEKVKI